LCYADDTLIITLGELLEEALGTAESATVTLTREIENLGLKIFPEKTEAMIFSKEKKRKNETLGHFLIRDITVTVKTHMK